ncbi:Bug family tripartite tricarboxylate transporter substrate binding protein [Achromobacter aloeverae]|uniref:ABC transporter substrate-binding protein n=1 Tax=Achromobacter aloeverae TaxID=1750518 RepID=A0A4Q1HHY3_9BURK|nr:ABC transporter substrate-binding protein [Achromobacter aloeverae]
MDIIRSSRRLALAAIVSTLGTLLASPSSQAAETATAATTGNWPEHPISLIVGYPPGGSVDLTARLIAKELSDRLGQNVVVVNQGGAGGTIGAQRVARAPADGYTLLLGSTNEMVIAGMINKAVVYDGSKDFTPLGIIATQPMLLAASPSAGVKSAAEYLTKLRGAPAGRYNFGSSGVGTTLHLAGEMVNQATQTQASHVPYRGVAPLVTDLMSGQLSFGMLVLSSGLPQVQAGKLVALGVTEKKRSPVAPDIPALAETPGFESVDINVWFALYGPAGLPAPIVKTLREALAASLQAPVFRAKMAESGGEVAAPGLDPATFQASEVVKYGKLVRAAKIESD